MHEDAPCPPALRPDPFSGPPWPVRAAALGPRSVTPLPQRLCSRGAVSWYFGAIIALLWLISAGQEIVAEAATTTSAVLGIAALVAYAVGFLVVVPLGWGAGTRTRLLLTVGLFALSFTMFPWLSWGVRGLWTYVGVALGMMVVSWPLTLTAITGLTLLAGWFGFLLDGWAEDDFWVPAITFSISLMMTSFARTLAAMNQLRATQDQLEAMAAERERGRMARDIHDILGHSLTVITVKSELASRLIDADPARAKAEVTEIEALARGALADVRATVAGSRGVTLSGELAAARVALHAAGIAAELPRATDAVPAARRELAAWVIREGVTNVVRHSRAGRCEVRIGEREIEIADDGVGPVASGASSTGLSGLRERVEAAGGRMSIGRSDLGGFSLKVML
nr:sensor histidine kinase [Microbacterium bovistercoris]